MSKRTRSVLRCGRTVNGAALVEGVVSLVLITIGTVAAVTLLVNAGMSTYYKEKIGFVTNQCATYAASLGANDDVEAKTEAIAKDLLKAMDMPTRAVKVKVEEKIIEDRTAVKVKLSVGGLGLFGTGDIIPTSISLEDTSIAIHNGTPSGYLWMNHNVKFAGYLFPVIKVPPGGPNSLGMPLYTP